MSLDKYDKFDTCIFVIPTCQGLASSIEVEHVLSSAEMVPLQHCAESRERLTIFANTGDNFTGDDLISLLISSSVAC